MGTPTPQRPDRTTARTNTSGLTPNGLRVAIFYTKVYDPLLRPLIAANQPPAPFELRRALATIDQAVHQYAHRARPARHRSLKIQGICHSSEPQVF